jgi:hypothetical protein
MFRAVGEVGPRIHGAAVLTCVGLSLRIMPLLPRVLLIPAGGMVAKGIVQAMFRFTIAVFGFLAAFAAADSGRAGNDKSTEPAQLIYSVASQMKRTICRRRASKSAVCSTTYVTMSWT